MRFGSSISPEHILTLSCFHISRPIKLAFYINLKASFESYLPVWGQRDQTILNIFTTKSEHIQMLIKFKWERIFLSSAIKLVVKKTFSEIPKNNTAKRFSPPHHPIAGDLPQISKSHSLTSDHLQLVQFYLCSSIRQTLEEFKQSLQLRKKNIRSRVISDQWEPEKTSFLGDPGLQEAERCLCNPAQCVGKTANPAHQTLHGNRHLHCRRLCSHPPDTLRSLSDHTR